METNYYTTYEYVNNTTCMVSFSLRRADQRKTDNMISMNNLFLSLSHSPSHALYLSLPFSLSLRINNSALEKREE